MISRIHFFAVIAAGILVCSLAGAQMRNATVHSTVQRPTVHARPASRAFTGSTGTTATALQSSRQASVIQISPSGQVTSGFDPIASSVSFDGVPGLGFDFPHLAAISGARRNNFSMHFVHRGHRGQGFFVPVLFGGYPYYEDQGYNQLEQQPAQQLQPQIIVIQQPVPAQQAVDTRSDTGNPSTPQPEAQAAAPVRDVGDFLLVRRDGRILFASVFSVVGTQLQYVTPEGIRHTLAMSDLDADATQQMNEARGTTLQIHN